MNYYIYRHIRLDKNEPFYIGLGTKRSDRETKSWKAEFFRAFQKHSRRNPIWQTIINKTDYEVEILMELETKEEALLKEKELIQLYGRINLGTGTLANLTDGGEGTWGRVVLEESKNKTVTAHKIPVVHKETGKIFNSIKEAANFIGWDKRKLGTYLKKGMPKSPFKYLEEKLNPVYKNKVKVPVINKKTSQYFSSVSEAARFEGVPKNVFDYYLWSQPPGFKYEFVDTKRKEEIAKQKVDKRTTKVINIKTNIVFNTIKEAADFEGANYDIFRNAVRRYKNFDYQYYQE